MIPALIVIIFIIFIALIRGLADSPELESRTYLRVPFRDKDKAKRRGAKWDPHAQQWFVPWNRDPGNFEEWIPKPLSAPKLTVELVPSTCWFSNVRSNVSVEDWRRLQQMTFRQAGDRCEICEGRGTRWPLECHEVWRYNDDTRAQVLERLIALCPWCHSVKHMGRSMIYGKEDTAFWHLSKVNRWSLEETKIYLKNQFQICEKRSAHSWKLDIRWLERHGIQVSQTDRNASTSSLVTPLNRQVPTQAKATQTE